MRREGKKLGIRTNQTIHYVPHCARTGQTKTFACRCEIHSHELMDFIYREQKRLDRCCNLSRLEQMQLAAQAVERVKPSNRTKAFRCLHGLAKYPMHEMRNYGYRSRKEPRDEMMDQLALTQI